MEVLTELSSYHTECRKRKESKIRSKKLEEQTYTLPRTECVVKKLRG